MSSAVSSESIYSNNSIRAPDRMYGVVNKLFLCQNERVDELNERISSRNIPSEPLQPFITKHRFLQNTDTCQY